MIAYGSPNDYVYIHFSGHGIRMKDGSLALVFFDAGPLGSKYLYGLILRSVINNMVEKGMLVTIVLDCCFSGSVLRTGRLQRSAIRYLEYDTAVDDGSDHRNPFVIRGGASFVLPRGQGPGERLLDPAGYTVLSACESHEEASEIVLENGNRRGALSYFLLDSLVALKKRRVQVSHQSLHQHLRASFHARYAHQTPMLFGRNGISFFDTLTYNGPTTLVTAYKDLQKGLMLDAGEAHGVHDNDEYALYPFTAPEKAPELDRQSHIQTRVITVHQLTSHLAIINDSDKGKVQDGSTWKARPLTSVSPNLPQVLLKQGILSSGELVGAARASPFLKVITESDQNRDDKPRDHLSAEAVIQVAVKDDSIYEVQDERGVNIPNFPTFHIHEIRANQNLLKALEHIATYKFMEKIENRIPNPEFEKSFSLSSKRFSARSQNVRS